MKLNHLLTITTVALLGLISCSKDLPYDSVYKDPDLVAVNTVDTESVHLYTPYTMETNRKTVFMAPFFQGDEKLVKFKFEEDGLKVYELDPDTRFATVRNNKPIISVPGTYHDFRCKEDQLGDCTNAEEENTELEWNQKKYFLPKFEKLIQNEVNITNLWFMDNECFKENSSNVRYSELKNGLFNIELEKDYSVSTNIFCIFRHFVDGLDNLTFKAGFHYSIVKIDDLATEGYQAVSYPIPEHSKFGFFKNETEYLNGNFDPQRPLDEIHLNRWGKKEIVYYLSDEFDKPQNALFKKATHQAFDEMNEQFKQTNLPIKLTLKNPAGIRVGDLRYNMIVLVDDPLANGLLGYGPSVKDPRTGEIVKAHTNMYSGVLRTTVRRVYNAMKDLSKDIYLRNVQSRNTDKSNLKLDVSALNVARSTLKSKEKSEAKNKSAQMMSSKNFILGKHRAELIAAKTSKVDNKKLTQMIPRAKAMMHARKHVAKAEPTIDRLLRLLNKREALTTFEEIELDNTRLEFFSERTGYAEEFFQIAHTVKQMIPGIASIPDLRDEKGIFKSWEQLSNKQVEQINQLILPHVYKATFVHEIGHNLGLRHNFAGSTDANNFYTKEEAQKLGLCKDKKPEDCSPPAYSSIMDYAVSELNELRLFGKYDIAALKFAYERKVETEKGEWAKVESTIEDLEDKGIALKDYEFCTDENAGLNVTCNRFDEGSSVTEMVQAAIKRYEDSYQYYNFRDGRKVFQDFGLHAYTVRRFRDFDRIREVFEAWEFFADIFGKELMINGCSDDQVNQYPVCKMINDRRDAVKIAGEFFVNVIKTPNHTCAVATKEEPTKITELKFLDSIYEEIKFRFKRHFTETCFDPKVKEYLAEQGLVPVAEGGKFLNGFKGNYPEYRFVNDRFVRGTWPDRAIAMMMLFDRTTNTGTTEENHGSFMDHNEIAPQVGNLLRHLILGEDLSETISFKSELGASVKIPYKIDLNYIIDGPNKNLVGLKRFFNLYQENGADTPMLQVLLQLAQWQALTNDNDYKADAYAIANSFSVRRYSTDSDINVERLEEVQLGDYVFAASETNAIAKEMIMSLDSEDLLRTIGKENAQKVLQRKLNPPLPADLSDAQQAAFKLPDNFIVETITLIQRGVTPDRDRLVALLGEELADQVLLAFSLGEQALMEILHLKDQQRQPPADAPAPIKQAFKLSNEILSKYVSGVLETNFDTYKKVLDLMPQHRRQAN